MNKLKKAYNIIGQVEVLISGLFLTIMVLIIFAAGLGRTIGFPIRWAMDMSTFLFAWAVFFSADIAMRNNRHVSVKEFVNRLPKKLQNYIVLLNYFIILVFLAFMIRYGILLSYITRFRAFQGIPGFSYTWITLSMPIGSIFLLITTILKIWNILKSEEIKIFKMKYKEI